MGREHCAGCGDGGCAACPLTANLPDTPEGAACLEAAQACVVGGEMVHPHVDLAAALAMAAALGVPADIAAPLLAACAHGVAMGLAERRAGANE